MLLSPRLRGVFYFISFYFAHGQGHRRHRFVQRAKNVIGTDYSHDAMPLHVCAQI
jgi:hypothetical protein